MGILCFKILFYKSNNVVKLYTIFCISELWHHFPIQELPYLFSSFSEQILEIIVYLYCFQGFSLEFS